MNAAKKALVFGATGLIGGHLVNRLLQHPAYGQVTAAGRSPLVLDHPKLVQAQIDFGNLDQEQALFHADEVFVCLGTTIRKAKTKDAFARVDLEYPAAIARAASRAGAGKLLVVSSMGADARSRIFYSRTKGQMEEAVSRAGLPSVHIFRPSILQGARQEKRPGESFGIYAARLLEPVLRGPLRKYRAIPADTVALAMIAAAGDDRRGVFIHESDELFQLAHDL